MIIGLFSNDLILTATAWANTEKCPGIIYETEKGTITNLPISSPFIRTPELIIRAQRKIVKSAITFKQSDCLKPIPLIYRLYEYISKFYPTTVLDPTTVYYHKHIEKNLVYPITCKVTKNIPNWYIKATEVLSHNDIHTLRRLTS